jgi:putative SOS response-associated peptidase YedK
MCGRFVSARQRQELIDEFGVERDQVDRDVAPDYNVAPTDPIYAVLTRAGREARDVLAGPVPCPGPCPGTCPGTCPGPSRELRLVRWGLVPSWAKDRSGGARLINARAETVAVKPSFRSAFARRRCLIPADGYYEWRPLGGREHGRPRKQPYYIHRADGLGMAFAGIYEFWRDAALPDDHPAAWLWTAAIITTQATDHVGWVHDRMPMVVSPAGWDEWLDPATGDADDLLKAITPAVSDDLETRPVSTAVNSVASDGPDLIAPLAAEDEPGNTLLAADCGPGEA